MTMEILPNFAVFEGGDGSGTSTQLSILARRFSAHSMGNPVVYPTFEPTEGPIGSIIRHALQKNLIFRPETLARLFAADRNEHLHGSDGIIERCQRGELVISDRYILSSYVYQGIECGDLLPRSLNSAFPAPELLLFFDIDPRIALERLQGRHCLEIYERIDFQEKVRKRYHSLLEEYRNAGVRTELIDASGNVEKVAADVWRAVSKMPIFGTG